MENRKKKIRVSVHEVKYPNSSSRKIETRVTRWKNKTVEVPRHKGLKIEPQYAHTRISKVHHCEISG